MAVLEKIRSRAGLLVGLIALALLSFVIQGLFSPGNSIFGGTNNNLGEINGNAVSGEEFQKNLTQLEETYKRSQNTQIDDNIRQQLVNQVWNDYLDKYLFDNEMGSAGVTVSDDELNDMLQGENIDPQVQNIPIFQDSVTKKFDVKKVKKFIQNQLTDENDPDGEYRRSWDEFKTSLRKQKFKNKYNNLIRKSVYITNAQAKREFAEKNNTAQGFLIVKPFESIADSKVSVSDEDLKKYYENHKHEFDQEEETRSIEYVVFQVNSTKKDRDDLLNGLEKIKADFQNASNDTDFVNANSSTGFSENLLKRGQLKAQIDSAIFKLSPGQVYGPYIDGEQIKLAKFLGMNTKADSVKARHILISTQNGMDVSKAKVRADSLKNSIKSGVVDFALLAGKFSDDPGSKTKGGDLGWFAEGMMVKPFNDACFNGNIGDLVVVETQFGVHLIEIQEKSKSTNKARVVFITRDIEPSSETLDKIYAEANDYAVSSQSYDQFKKQAELKNYVIGKFENLKLGDRNINEISGCREVVQWVFNADREENQVSKLFSLDQKYLVAVFKGKKEKGIPTLDQLKADIEPLAKKQKKADMLIEELEKNIRDASNMNILSSKLKLPVDTIKGVQFSSFNLEKHGYEPKVVGAIFSTQAGKFSKPVQGNKGVFVFYLEKTDIKKSSPKEINDLKAQIISQKRGFADGGVYTSILKKGKIEDKRSMYY